MVKFRDASPGAAYEIAVGVFDADEAAKLGLAVVESTPDGRPSAYGRYKGAPDGGPLGVTVAGSSDTEVVPGGAVSPGADVPAGGNKGNLVNPNDPFVHGGTGDESVHADGSEPPVEDLAAEQREATEVAEQSIEKASKPTKSK